MKGQDSYRWVVLVAGTVAQASYSAVFLGVAVMLPALRERYGLTLGQAGIVVAAASVGSLLSLLAWGLAADRFGERRVVAAGLVGAAGALAGAGWAGDTRSLVALLVLAGLAGAAVNAASGRAVMHWFDVRQRGLALGIRQTAIPIGGASVALGLPHVVDAGGTEWGFVALAAGSAGGGVLAAVLLRERAHEPDPGLVGGRPLRDPRIWRLLAATGVLVFPQTVVFSYTVLFLHDHRGLTPSAAAGALAAVQVLAIGARVGTGRWSDVVGSRIRPLRRIALAATALTGTTAALAGAPLAALVPVLVLTGAVAISWNGLSFTAAAELAGYARAGAALGMQQTVIALGGAAMPPLFALAVGRLGWSAAWALAATGPAAAFVLLRGLRA